MKIKEGFMLRQVADSWVVVAIGKASTTFKGVINLNESGAFLWKEMEKNSSEEELVKSLLNEYNVDEAVARRDVTMFINKLKNASLIE